MRRDQKCGSNLFAADGVWSWDDPITIANVAGVSCDPARTSSETVVRPMFSGGGPAPPHAYICREPLTYRTGPSCSLLGEVAGFAGLPHRNNDDDAPVTPPGPEAILCRGKCRVGETAYLGEDAISDQFIRQHYAGLHALLQRRIGDANTAAEMLNEAVATALKHTREGRVAQPERLAGYVFRVAMNLYRNYRRDFDNRAELRARTNDIQQVPYDAGGDALEASVVREVRAIVLSLPTARDREIVTRFYLDEEAKDDICRSLGLSPLHFDKVIFRARRRLRALLEQRGFSKTDFFGVLLVFLG